MSAGDTRPGAAKGDAMTSMSMERLSASEPKAWTTRRVLLWVGASVLLLFLVAVAMGFTAAQLDRGTGEHLWRERLRWGTVGLPALILGGIGLQLWRQSRRAERLATPGEARAVRRSRSFWTVMGAQLIAGTVVGGLGAHFVLHPERMPAGAGAWIALALAIVTAVAMIWGALALYPRMDELELQDNLWAGSAAGSTVGVIYPPWYMLWVGGWVPEPSHEVMFGLLLFITCAVYLWRKSRR
jgi:hypothetical protein